jgi:SAM-dependent methyltransferase
MTETQDDIRPNVQEYYAKAANQTTSCCGSNTLYESDLLTDLPSDVANFSLGCGNPITLAKLQPGETVLDLGSGGGLDCFLAAREVGDTGHVIGIDMTPEMLERSRISAKKMGMNYVEFRQGYLEDLPVEDATIDAIISNCVINLSPDKSKVFEEIFRVLKPGGRIAVSDIVTNGEIPDAILKMKDSWNSCAAGALPMEEFIGGLEEAGFIDVELKAKGGDDFLAEIPETGLFSAAITARKQ